jgi:hypothetical protein
MTGKKFFNAVANGQEDILQIFLEILEQTGARYCVVGGLAVNAYVEPVVSLDLDVVVEANQIKRVCKYAAKRGMKIEEFEHSINLSSRTSDLRIQIQTDARYQAFLPEAESRDILGYNLNVASLRDVLQGKTWAYQDEKRRKSKRQKDLTDILRIIESFPELEKDLPPSISKKIQSL